MAGSYHPLVLVSAPGAKTDLYVPCVHHGIVRLVLVHPITLGEVEHHHELVRLVVLLATAGSPWESEIPFDRPAVTLGQARTLTVARHCLLAGDSCEFIAL